MSDTVLTLLKFGLLGALYVFFAWVLWSAFSQLRATPAAAAAVGQRTVRAPAASNGGSHGQMTILEPPDLAGAVMSLSLIHI